MRAGAARGSYSAVMHAGAAKGSHRACKLKFWFACEKLVCRSRTVKPRFTDTALYGFSLYGQPLSRRFPKSLSRFTDKICFTDTVCKSNFVRKANFSIDAHVK
jgi:hypothetical protein